MGRRFVVDKLGIMWRRKRERGSGIIPENLFRLTCEKGEPFFCSNVGAMVPLIGKNRRGQQLLDLLEFKSLGLSN